MSVTERDEHEIQVTESLVEIERDYLARDFDAALDKVRHFKNSYPAYQLSIIGCLIDIGSIKQQRSLIEEAISIYESHSNSDLPGYLYYNAANGYLSLFHMTLDEGTGYFEGGKYALKAIELFRRASQSEPNVLTNYANALDEIGRPIEAIKSYDNALKIDGNFGMALGNKALAIRKLAVISQYQGAYLIYAYQHYKKALEHEVSIRMYADDKVITTFKKEMAYIESLFKDEPKRLDVDLTHPALKQKASKFVKHYTDFCLSNDLYINLHFFSNITSASIGDTLGVNFVDKKPLKVADDLNDLAFRLNEIKEAYIGARLSLVQSQYINNDFSNISMQTLIINPLDYSVSNIYTSYLKMAFKEAFSVLDKIAIFLNHYLELGYDENNRRLSYHSVWYKNLDRNNDVNEGFDVHDANLFGLYSLLQDIRSSEFDEIRNALTHRYVRLFRSMSVKDEYDYEDFVGKTIDLMGQIKCAIIYLHNFINTHENSKKSPEDRLITMRFHTDQWLDIWE